MSNDRIKEYCRMLEERAKQEGVSLDELKAHLFDVLMQDTKEQIKRCEDYCSSPETIIKAKLAMSPPLIIGDESETLDFVMPKWAREIKNQLKGYER